MSVTGGDNAMLSYNLFSRHPPWYIPYTPKHLNTVCRVCSWWRHQMETFFALLADVREYTGLREFRRGALMFSLTCAWTYVWVINRDVDDLRPYRAHYDAIVKLWLDTSGFLDVLLNFSPINWNSTQLQWSNNFIKMLEKYPRMIRVNYRLISTNTQQSASLVHLLYEICIGSELTSRNQRLY